MIAHDADHVTIRSKADAFFTPGRFFLLLAGIIAIRFASVLVGGQVFFYRDFGVFGFPLAHYQRECFWRGELLPLWNPLNFCGLPFLAQWNTLCLYPPSLFYLLLPLTWALPVFNLAHLILAGMGMYFLGRRWTGSQLAASVAGMAYAFNGLMLHALMWPNDIAGLAWMPWVALTMERAWSEGGRAQVWAALAGGMQMLSGAPEIILLTWVFTGACWLIQFGRGSVPRKKMFFRFFLVCGLIAGLAAAQLLPFIDLLAHSQRDAGFGGGFWAMPGWGWANFLVPLFHCSPSVTGVFSQDAQQWTSSYYMGIGVAALGVLGFLREKNWRVWWLGVAVVAGVVLAMGENAFIYGWVKRVFPLIGVMRFPIKIVVITVFALPLLAAFALKRQSENSSAAGGRTRFLIVGIVMAILVVGILVYASRFPLPGELWQVTRTSGLTRLFFLAMILGAAWLICNARSTERTVAWAGTALLLLVALDGLTHTPNQNPTVPKATYGALGIRETVQARAGESRALIHPKLQSFLRHAATPNLVSYYEGQRRALYMDCNLIDDIPTVGGFYSLELRSASSVCALLASDAAAIPEPLADFVGASQISSSDTSFSWTARSHFMPLISAGQSPVFADEKEILKGIVDSNFNPRTTVYLPVAARDVVHATADPTASISSPQFTAERVEFDVTAKIAAMAVVSQALYHPWHAYVDGARVDLWEANGAFQALEVPAGKHHVRLVYEDTVFKGGLMLSLCSLAAVLGLAIWGGK